jgi:hypothetical protein
VLLEFRKPFSFKRIGSNTRIPLPVMAKLLAVAVEIERVAMELATECPIDSLPSSPKFESAQQPAPDDIVSEHIKKLSAVDRNLLPSSVRYVHKTLGRRRGRRTREVHAHCLARRQWLSGCPKEGHGPDGHLKRRTPPRVCPAELSRAGEIGFVRPPIVVECRSAQALAGASTTVYWPSQDTQNAPFQSPQEMRLRGNDSKPFLLARKQTAMNNSVADQIQTGFPTEHRHRSDKSIFCETQIFLNLSANETWFKPFTAPSSRALMTLADKLNKIET